MHGEPFATLCKDLFGPGFELQTSSNKTNMIDASSYADTKNATLFIHSVLAAKKRNEILKYMCHIITNGLII